MSGLGDTDEMLDTAATLQGHVSWFHKLKRIKLEQDKERISDNARDNLLHDL